MTKQFFFKKVAECLKEIGILEMGPYGAQHPSPAMVENFDKWAILADKLELEDIQPVYRWANVYFNGSCDFFETEESALENKRDTKCRTIKLNKAGI